MTMTDGVRGARRWAHRVRVGSLAAMIGAWGTLAIAPGARAALAPGYRLVRVTDAVVSNTDRTLAATDMFSDAEDSIGINPANPDELVILGSSGSWGSPAASAPLFHSSNGGATWSKLFTIPVPPGGFSGPLSQTLDWGRGGLDFSFAVGFPGDVTDVVSVRAVDPTAPGSFVYRVAGGVAVITNDGGVAGAANFVDQPWIDVNRDPFIASQDDTYVAFSRLAVTPVEVHVAVSKGASPLAFAVDQVVGHSDGSVAAGVRLTGDAGTGAMVAVWGTCVANCRQAVKSIAFMLNRSRDGGTTWDFGGAGTAIAVADSTQPFPKFGTANELLGGVHHAAVDPATGAVYYVYGNKAPGGNDRLAIRRVTFNGAGAPAIGAEHLVTTAEAALPQVAVDSHGTVGVFFYSFDGFTATGLPIFTAHFSMSTDQGTTFVDQVLVTVVSPQPGSARDDGQRVLGDYQQTKAVGSCFHGAFTANGNAFGRAVSNTDPAYFKVCRQADACVLASQSLDLRDRDQIAAPVAAGTFLTLGSAATIVDDPQVNGGALLRDRAVVQGDLTLHGVLQRQGQVTITGTLRENAADVLIPTLATRTFAVGAGTQAVANDAVVTLAPGNFGNMTFRARAQVTLTAGTYDFASLNVEPDVRLNAIGVVNVNVQGALTIGDRDRITAAAPRNLTLYTNRAGTVTVGTDVVATALLVGPSATVNVASRLTLSGCIGARNLTIDTDAHLTANGATLPVATP